MLRDHIDDFIDRLNQNKCSPPDGVVVLYVDIGPFAIDMSDLYEIGEDAGDTLFHMDMESGISTNIEELADESEEQEDL
jgi:hypothetical protein